MERFFRINDKVLKFMTVLLDEAADLEAIKAEIAEKEAAKTPAPAPAAQAEETVEKETPTEASEAPEETKEKEEE
jgi:small subunit ribosomal protein S6